MKILLIGGKSDNSPLASRQQREKLNIFSLYLLNALVQLNEAITINICSTYEDSLDFYFLKELSQALENKINIFLYSIDERSILENVEKKIEELNLSEKVKIFKSIPVLSYDEKSLKYAWLMCQIKALEDSEFIISFGGSTTGSAINLLSLALFKRLTIINFTFLKGASELIYSYNRFNLMDKFGERFISLIDDREIEQNSINECIAIIKNSKNSKFLKNNASKFFISYPTARPESADQIETILRRRGLKVYRDETKFGASENIHQRIQEEIKSCNIFIATWCQEYACSPWCFDELEMALDLHEEGLLNLWIFRIDDTRIIPKRARNLKNYRINTRVELEGEILKLLSNDISE